MPKRRREESNETTIYTQCSASAQSRRRQQLYSFMCQQAGSSDPGELTSLLEDTLRAHSKPTCNSMMGSALDQVLSNIKVLHDVVPLELRTAILALVANVFTSAELKTRGFAFGTHQFQEARRLVDVCFAGVFNEKQKFVPKSKMPKSEDFIRRVVAFVKQFEVDGVVGRPVRALHREFVKLSEENQVSFSTFRAIVVGRFRLPTSGSSGQPSEGVSRETGQVGSLVDPMYPFSLLVSQANPMLGIQSLLLDPNVDSQLMLDFSSLGVDTSSISGSQQLIGAPENSEPDFGRAAQGLLAPLNNPINDGTGRMQDAGGSVAGIPTIQRLFNMAALNPVQPTAHDAASHSLGAQQSSQATQSNDGLPGFFSIFDQP
ncbi:hypothetical protein BX070DRAFT_221005 [Coemansia spiralis]|nr:hypothetical protein BX070DRAFT_221005 [Coemansia spiralis]